MLRFPGKPIGRTPNLSTNGKAPPAEKLKCWVNLTSRALLSILAGNKPDCLPPLDLSSATLFQRRVWSALQRIPIGCTRSYSQVAKSIGSPKACRAIGQACRANPIPVLIPCHRVLPANKGVGSFSAGAKWKRLLLDLERKDLTPAMPRSRRSRHHSSSDNEQL
ncbi:MAG: methylated-DNA--[protein]-cysteine S-methyltransferase [Verrucomicrobiae bacterium]|nr:methylated-DNA--[protein]-cysteine S-methyltransferase [Verrucomicrobiae bacterium]